MKHSTRCCHRRTGESAAGERSSLYDVSIFLQTNVIVVVCEARRVRTGTCGQGGWVRIGGRVGGCMGGGMAGGVGAVGCACALCVRVACAGINLGGGLV